LNLSSSASYYLREFKQTLFLKSKTGVRKPSSRRKS
jgi:hypothetical protein